jgi:hypothetical protein
MTNPYFQAAFYKMHSICEKLFKYMNLEYVLLIKFFNFFRSAVPAKCENGDRLILYLGIIDILQSYRIKKRMEHVLKSVYADGVS